MYVLTILIIAALLLASLTLLRLRVRFEVGQDGRWLFVGLGRSGLRLDYIHKQREWQLWGHTMRREPLTARKTSKAPAETTKSKDETDPGKADTETSRNKRRIPWQEALQLAPAVVSALWSSSLELLRSLIVEQLQAEVEGGFEEPDLTGMAFGYYQAALAAAPGLVSHVGYTPVWTEAGFVGQARGSIALPLYRLILVSVRMAWRLPLRQLIKLAIGNRKGVQDGE